MGFWFFMFCMALLIPVSMILIGRHYARKAPRTINPLCGYRTARSMQNEDTWVFAHHFFGRLWRKTGWWLLFPSVLVMLPAAGKSETATSLAGGLATCVQLVGMIIPIFFTERALKRTFDERGMRKS